jgi:hypothetical protein
VWAEVSARLPSNHIPHASSPADSAAAEGGSPGAQGGGSGQGEHGELEQLVARLSEQQVQALMRQYPVQALDAANTIIFYRHGYRAGNRWAARGPQGAALLRPGSSLPTCARRADGCSLAHAQASSRCWGAPGRAPQSWPSQPSLHAGRYGIPYFAQLSAVMEYGFGNSIALSILYGEVCARLGLHLNGRAVEEGRCEAPRAPCCGAVLRALGELRCGAAAVDAAAWGGANSRQLAAFPCRYMLMWPAEVPLTAGGQQMVVDPYGGGGLMAADEVRRPSCVKRWRRRCGGLQREQRHARSCPAHAPRPPARRRASCSG